MLGRDAVRVLVSVALAYLFGLIVWLTGWGELDNPYHADTLAWARWTLAGLIAVICAARAADAWPLLRRAP